VTLLLLVVSDVDMERCYLVYCFVMGVEWLGFLFIVVLAIDLGCFVCGIHCFLMEFLLMMSHGTFNFHQPP